MFCILCSSKSSSCVSCVYLYVICVLSVLEACATWYDLTWLDMTSLDMMLCEVWLDSTHLDSCCISDTSKIPQCTLVDQPKWSHACTRNAPCGHHPYHSRLDVPNWHDRSWQVSQTAAGVWGVGRAFYAVLHLKLFKTFPKTNRWDRLFFLISELVEL